MMKYEVEIFWFFNWDIFVFQNIVVNVSQQNKSLMVSGLMIFQESDDIQVNKQQQKFKKVKKKYYNNIFFFIKWTGTQL